ncbi:DUF58 domain-containing protein [Colwelliaceae bacterium BS250]
METFIDPKTLARIKDLPLIAKTVAEGFLHGVQPSQQRGIGIEFSQYRSYEPGDDLSRIDWKLFGRSDRYFVREAERESETTIWLVLDASASMTQQSQPQNLTAAEQNNGWSKFDYGRHLIATIAYLALKQGDSVGFMGLSSEQLSFLPAGGGDQQWHRILQQLSTLNSGAVFPNKNLIKPHIEQLQRSGLVFLISDFYQANNEITQTLKQLAHGQSEVVAMHLLCSDELNFPYKGAIRFRDSETKEEVLVASANAKEIYQQALQQHLTELKKQLTQLRISHNQVNIEQPLDQVLYDYLQLRAKGRA